MIYRDRSRDLDTGLWSVTKSTSQVKKDWDSVIIVNISGTPTKKAKLVSYIDPDAGLSDDDRQSGNDNDSDIDREVVHVEFVEPMDLESDDENKENGLMESIGNGDGENDEVDEKERSHCMEEMWDGGK